MERQALVGQLLDEHQALQVGIGIEPFAALRTARMDGAVTLFPLAQGMNRNPRQSCDCTDFEQLTFRRLFHYLNHLPLIP